MQVITNPSAEDIRQAVAQFDSENEMIEAALGELFSRYPQNTDSKEILLKVTALNTLYSTQIPAYNTRIPAIFDVVAHIVRLNIDSDLSRGDDGIVSRIAAMKVPSKAARFYYSFATKYCSWHNPSAYPIFDSRVLAFLWFLRKNHHLSKFHQASLWDYPTFKGVVEEFQVKNGLESFPFKRIDKFLYLQGGLLLNGQSERKVEEDGTILVPVPGQPGEMEWSVENYASPEEAALSRQKFTTPLLGDPDNGSVTIESPDPTHNKE